MTTAELFPGFQVKAVPYKEVNGHEILAGIIVPENLAPGKHPIIARFHGGFLATGGHAIWFQSWLKDYAKLHSAIIVAADYRLIPEHNGLEMMQDLSDFWDWVFKKLPSFLDSGIEADLDKILIEGDSAGGYLAVQSALDLGTKAKAMMAVYPPIDLKIPFFTTAYERNMVGFPMYPADTIEKHMASVKPTDVASTAEPPLRLELGFSAIQQGRFVELLGSDPILFPMERLDTVEHVPSMMILHGENDSGVPYKSSEAFVEKLKETHPQVKVHYNVVPDCEHGLDAVATLDTPWLKEGLDFITPLWLGSGTM
ncbi:hypothetical protein BP6252_13828 [Coleophoma cylindrospora]|uniref:Alpha/beta hydrolase fold-3 domain-containing protein n=1 Tax=Coleophoma cylindrospora TaxID=1849047 RepID=A0A3D8Q685_9HELO|nr:hypothetical protein BP6252_13828 [Coleophoma cylindrospora]